MPCVPAASTTALAGSVQTHGQHFIECNNMPALKQLLLLLLLLPLLHPLAAPSSPA